MRNRLFGVLLAALVGTTSAHAACWSWSKTASANATADASINWSEGMSPSSVNDSARAMMARLAECRDDISGALLTTGGAVAYAVTTNQGLNAIPVDGQQIVVRLNVNNGAASTLAADGGTAYAIQSAPGTAVASGTLVAGTPYRLTFNLASTAWVLQDFYNAPVAVHSVTYNKIQQVAASRLLGNATGSLADVTEIPLGAGLEFSSGSLAAQVNPSSIQGYISGLTLSTAGASATFGIAVGAASDVASGGMITLGSAYTKTTSAWTVGSAGGALDTGVIANSTWYHAFIIKRPDTAVVDVCVGTDPTTGCAAGVGNIPAAYTLKRRIGSMKTTAGGQWTAFTQVGDQFLWSVTVNNVSAGAVTSVSRTLQTMTVPTGIQVNALFRSLLTAGGTLQLMFTSPSESDQAVTNDNCDFSVSTTATIQSGRFSALTNTSAQIGIRASNAGGTGLYVSTYGWIDARGKN